MAGRHPAGGMEQQAPPKQAAQPRRQQQQRQSQQRAPRFPESDRAAAASSGVTVDHVDVEVPMDGDEDAALGSGESAAQPEEKRPRTRTHRSESRHTGRPEDSRPNIFKPNAFAQGIASVAEGIGSFVHESLQTRAPPTPTAAAAGQPSGANPEGRSGAAEGTQDPRAPFTSAQRSWLDAALADSSRRR